MATSVVITANPNGTVEFKRMNGVEVLQVMLFSSCFQIDWNKSADENIFDVFSGDKHFILELREVSAYSTAQDLYNHLLSLVDCSTGGGGGGDASAANQVDGNTLLNSINTNVSTKEKQNEILASLDTLNTDKATNTTLEAARVLLENILNVTASDDNQVLQIAEIQAVATAIGLLAKKTDTQPVEVVSTPHKHFITSSGVSSVTLPTTNTEYVLFAMRVKTGMGTVQMNKFIGQVTSLSNDNLIIKFGINKTLSTPFLNADFVDVATDSKIQVAKSAFSPAVPRTVSGFGAGGRDIQQFEVLAGQQGVGNEDQEPLAEGDILYCTGTPLSTSALARWAQNWEEPQ